MFYPNSMLDQMLNAVIGYCGEFFSSHIANWQHEDFKRRCYYTFIPGETINPTDSGHTYVRKLRNKLGVPEERIKDYRSLYDILDDEKDTLPVVFVDDFVGSGAQCCTAWNCNREGRSKYTLSEIALQSNHKFIYAPLVANYIGYDRIKRNCKGLELVTCHQLSNEYNLFDPLCICWENNNELYNRGIELILNKSREQGIPFTMGKAVVDAKGFDEQGLALAFDDDGVPDAIPAFFYWCSDTWTPLIKKEYKR
ncbi:hypothetical protein FACS189442_3510 [Spirochaetia bacterium]|nr:hypothetical protein FACS189442_3510 [Spirochaetia bacterium]